MRVVKWQVLSNEEVSSAVDLWALGCIIFQMLVGKPPFKVLLAVWNRAAYSCTWTHVQLCLRVISWRLHWRGSQAASEYLTFQRIAACEYSIPAEAELPPDAEALIRQLLVLEPSQRLGEQCSSMLCA